MQFSDDTSAQNFFYDTWVYTAGDSNGFANLEFDTEQTMVNGQTVVMGFQCDSWSGTWDYARNAGSATSPNDTWGSFFRLMQCSLLGCQPVASRADLLLARHFRKCHLPLRVARRNAAEHRRYYLFRMALGWGPAILTQFQVDGNSSGTTWANIYLDELTVKRW